MYAFVNGPIRLTVNGINDRLVEYTLTHPKYAAGRLLVIDKIASRDTDIPESAVAEHFVAWVRIFTQGDHMLPKTVKDFSGFNPLADEFEDAGEAVMIYAQD